MRRFPWLLVAVVAISAGPLAGCLQVGPIRAPMVLVQEAYSLEGGAADLAPEDLLPDVCSMTSYAVDPPHVEAAHPEMPDGWRPTFTVVVDRTVDGTDERLVHMAGSGTRRDGPVEEHLTTPYGGASSVGMAALGDRRDAGGYHVAWEGGRALLDGTPLEEGVGVERTVRYPATVRSDGAGGAHVVNVTLDLRVTYLGWATFDVQRPPAACG